MCISATHLRPPISTQSHLSVLRMGAGRRRRTHTPQLGVPCDDVEPYCKLHDDVGFVPFTCIAWQGAGERASWQADREEVLPLGAPQLCGWEGQSCRCERLAVIALLGSNP